MDRRVTPPKRVTSPTLGPSLPCKQALNFNLLLESETVTTNLQGGQMESLSR